MYMMHVCTGCTVVQAARYQHMYLQHFNAPSLLLHSLMFYYSILLLLFISERVAFHNRLWSQATEVEMSVICPHTIACGVRRQRQKCLLFFPTQSPVESGDRGKNVCYLLPHNRLCSQAAEVGMFDIYPYTIVCRVRRPRQELSEALWRKPITYSGRCISATVKCMRKVMT